MLRQYTGIYLKRMTAKFPRHNSQYLGKYLNRVPLIHKTWRQSIQYLLGMPQPFVSFQYKKNNFSTSRRNSFGLTDLFALLSNLPIHGTCFLLYDDYEVVNVVRLSAFVLRPRRGLF